MEPLSLALVFNLESEIWQFLKRRSQTRRPRHWPPRTRFSVSFFVKKRKSSPGAQDLRPFILRWDAISKNLLARRRISDPCFVPRLKTLTFHFSAGLRCIWHVAALLDTMRFLPCYESRSVVTYRPQPPHGAALAHLSHPPRCQAKST